MNKEEFLEKHKYFSTSQATKAGFTKKELKTMAGLVIIGTYPILNENGTVSVEKVYIHDPELELNVKKIRKAVRKFGSEDNAKKEITAIGAEINKILHEGYKNDREERNT